MMYPDSHLHVPAFVLQVPVQPGVDTKCAWLKTNALNDNMAAFVHRTRCNAALNATTVAAPGNKTFYKYCPHVGDAYYDVIKTFGNATSLMSYAQCIALCDAEPACAACQTDGHACTLMTVRTLPTCGDTPPGCDAWFRIF